MSKTLHVGMFRPGSSPSFQWGGDWSGNDENGHSGSQHGNWWNIHDEHEGFPPSQVCWPSKSTVSKEMDTKQISGKTQTWWCVHKFLWIPSRDNHPTWWISKQNMTVYQLYNHYQHCFAAWLSKLSTLHASSRTIFMHSSELQPVPTLVN